MLFRSSSAPAGSCGRRFVTCACRHRPRNHCNGDRSLIVPPRPSINRMGAGSSVYGMWAEKEGILGGEGELLGRLVKAARRMAGMGAGRQWEGGGSRSSMVDCLYNRQEGKLLPWESVQCCQNGDHAHGEGRPSPAGGAAHAGLYARRCPRACVCRQRRPRGKRFQLPVHGKQPRQWLRVRGKLFGELKRYWWNHVTEKAPA